MEFYLQIRRGEHMQIHIIGSARAELAHRKVEALPNCPALTVPCLVQQVFALGFVSVFDQITEGLPGEGPSDIFNAYMTALQEDPEQYRKYSPCLPSNTITSFAVYSKQPPHA